MKENNTKKEIILNQNNQKTLEEKSPIAIDDFLEDDLDELFELKNGLKQVGNTVVENEYDENNATENADFDLFTELDCFAKQSDVEEYIDEGKREDTSEKIYSEIEELNEALNELNEEPIVIEEDKSTDIESELYIKKDSKLNIKNSFVKKNNIKKYILIFVLFILFCIFFISKFNILDNIFSKISVLNPQDANVSLLEEPLVDDLMTSSILEEETDLISIPNEEILEEETTNKNNLKEENQNDIFLDLRLQIETIFQLSNIYIEENQESLRKTLVIEGKTNKSSIKEINELVFEIQSKSINTLMENNLFDIKIILSNSNDTYTLTTPREIISFVNGLHYLDRHSIQFWWDNTSIYNLQGQYKDTITKNNLYVPAVPAHWETLSKKDINLDTLILSLNDLQNAVNAFLKQEPENSGNLFYKANTGRTITVKTTKTLNSNQEYISQTNYYKLLNIDSLIGNYLTEREANILKAEMVLSTEYGGDRSKDLLDSRDILDFEKKRVLPAILLNDNGSASTEVNFISIAVTGNVVEPDNKENSKKDEENVPELITVIQKNSEEDLIYVETPNEEGVVKSNKDLVSYKNMVISAQSVIEVLLTDGKEIPLLEFYNSPAANATATLKMNGNGDFSTLDLDKDSITLKLLNIEEINKSYNLPQLVVNSKLTAQDLEKNTFKLLNTSKTVQWNKGEVLLGIDNENKVYAITITNDEKIAIIE